MESITSKRQELVQKTDLKSLMWQTLGYTADGDNKVKHVIGCIVRLKKKCSHKGPKLGNSDLSNQKCELDQKTNASFLLVIAVVKKTCLKI